MKSFPIVVLTAISLFISCEPTTYHVEKSGNLLYRPNTIFKSYEDLILPRFEHLRTKYQIDTVFHGETDELKRILLLRHWIKSVISIDDYGDPYPGDNNPEGILDAALQGTGFHCGHFMRVQNAVMNAYGYVTRTLGAGPGGTDGKDGHHGINEIWLNSMNKWFLSDAKYDHHFEKDGIPLNALEVRDEFLKNRAKEVVLVKGPDRTPIDFDKEIGRSKEEFAHTYTWVEWHQYNNMFSAWPDDDGHLIMYEDDYFKNNKWIWGGKPHWAYDTEFMILVNDCDAIYWTPNTIRSKVTINNKKATIVLYSDTPNLKAYELKSLPDGRWQATTESLTVELKDKRHEWDFRTVNLAGVSGPEHKIIIKRE